MYLSWGTTGVKASVVFTVLLFCLYCVSTVAIIRVFFQCCRSGAGYRTVWIRIDFDLFLLGVFCLDLDPAFKSRYNTQTQIETLVLAVLWSMGYCHDPHQPILAADPDTHHCFNILTFLLKVNLHIVLICFRLRAISTASSSLLRVCVKQSWLCFVFMPHLLIFYKFMSSVWKKTTQQQTTPGFRDVPFSSPRTTREQLPMPLTRRVFAAETWPVSQCQCQTLELWR